MDKDLESLLWEISVFLGNQANADIVDGEMIGNEAMRLNQKLGEWLE